ncbi:MAG: ABC-type transport system involved in lipoprotein release [Thermodesulfobacterium sp.]|uniref:ABC-type transport system involved in lipoprotein release n=1 Tax=Candidatus Thermodesulfobacterium syntrophicum TaxID=3060442 RepID=A0AAE3P552_9BACT|nr:ABC-type transport system involved in lipoprotein release [Candidatus Thermodesulfobacterium syntrophicum]
MFNFGWELWIALRYVFSSKREKFTGIISLIAIIGVALSVGALTVVNSVITGFKEAVSEKILSLNPHLSITFRNPEYEKRITEIIKKEIPSKEIKSIQKVSTLQGLIIFSGQPVGIILKATNLQELQKEKGFKKFEFNPLYLNNKEKVLPVIIGEKLKERLGLGLGEKVKFMSAEGFYTPFGFFPKVITFIVAGTFQTGIYDYDLNLVFVPFDAFSQKFNPSNYSLEIKLKDPFKSHQFKTRLLSHLGFGITIFDWQEWNRNLFAALKMEKLGLFVVLTLMIIVSLFTIIAAMIMLVTEKKMDIAILRALGVSSQSILKIFFFCGLILSLTGVIFGLMLGGFLCAVLSHYPIIKLPSEVYPVEYMPVKLKVLDVFVISVVAVFISILACIYPAKKASEIIPAEILRHG